MLWISSSIDYEINAAEKIIAEGRNWQAPGLTDESVPEPQEHQRTTPDRVTIASGGHGFDRQRKNGDALVRAAERSAAAFVSGRDFPALALELFKKCETYQSRQARTANLRPCVKSPRAELPAQSPSEMSKRICLGLNSHVANPANHIIACALVCLDCHNLDRIGSVVRAQNHIVAG
jgi:hypothetical protein